VLTIINKFGPYALCLFLCYAAFKMRWLTRGGALSAFLMALVFTMAGVFTFILPLVLLVGGSLLSKLNKEHREPGGRSTIQVLANGAVGTLCLFYFVVMDGQTSEASAFLAYLISFCISISDTFSSESGKFFKGKTIDIISFGRVEPGLSGAVSLEGSIGGLVGSALSAGLSYLIFAISAQTAICIGLLGFAGMLLDSVLGSLFQAKYKNPQGGIVEYVVPGADHYKGYTWFTNDVVNVVSNAIVVILFLALH
jgi:uncharacterized protein (TIGR00297 family)